ncbi:putative DNA-directed RNA polymerase I and III subunit Rpc40 [Aulographum hederae CBS 113979]|uniref:DNA-directed RNA polymerases I and III subunit RPAC1 n=1 Tax=Aulographum hederae CBS 113979 TaxID=1176131 RepID=A0A6G1H9Q2_9PEZI|nr:putative DNA-directed RNA polymerase I and III subunit Rpc40 [Aulographum hederae CBS 113979]
MDSGQEEELRSRRLVGINVETVTDVSSSDYPGRWPNEDLSWNLEAFQNKLRVEFHTNDKYDASFSVVGIDAAVANAFRRIMISEIPTVAIETVYLMNNTSIIHDEVLAHRLGLIPLTGNKAGMKWLRWRKKPPQMGPNTEEAPPYDFNNLVLDLDVECTWHPGGKARAAEVYAHQLVFQPQGRQSEYFSPEQGEVRPCNPDILIAKLRPGQAIKCTLFAVKGIGADHAKFSPVCPASYRLLPDIDIRAPILGEHAKKFARCFPKGVIALEPVTATEARKKGSGYEGHEGEMKAVVKDPMRDTVSRECLRHPEFKDKVRLGRVRDHFIFRVESSGQFESDELFLDSVKLLKEKTRKMKFQLDRLMTGSS